MNRRKFLLKLNKSILIFEMLISIILIIGILISIPDIINYYVVILKSDVEISASLFKAFLSHVLILVIAMEFILSMVAQTDITIIHLITLVITRKMLIESKSMSDILIGVLAITVLFIVRKYLTHGSSSSELILAGHNKVFSASAVIDEINNKYNYHIEAEIENKDIETLGGLVSILFEMEGRDLEIGEMIDDGKYIYEIEKYQNGVIEEVSIHHIK